MVICIILLTLKLRPGESLSGELEETKLVLLFCEFELLWFGELLFLYLFLLMLTVDNLVLKRLILFNFGFFK